jgi:membrane-associated protease RseP (regulator of RpoE activity)
MMARSKKVLIAPGASFIINRLISKKLSPAHLVILTSHEAGHYVAARSVGLDPEPPVVMGIGPLNFGYVKAKRGTSKQRTYVAVYGPIAAIICICIIFSFSLLLQSFSLFLISCSAFVAEVYNLLLGPDSKKVFS